MLITTGGDYWLATAAGVVHFNPRATTPDSKFKTYVSTQRSGSELVATLYQDNQRIAALSLQAGQLQLQNQKRTEVTTAQMQSMQGRQSKKIRLNEGDDAVSILREGTERTVARTVSSALPKSA